MGAFRLIASSFILVMFMYVCHQLVRFIDMDWWWRMGIVVGLGLLFIMVIATFLFFWKEKSLDHQRSRDFLLNVSLTVMAYINFLVTFVIIRDIYAFIEYLILPIPITLLYSTEATLLLLGVPLILLVLGNAVVQVGARLVKVPIFFKNLPQELEGIRILHISDLHISPSLPACFVRKLVKKVMALDADVVVLTGDILDSFAEKHTKEFAYLKKLKVRRGIFLVPGNHEYYWDAKNAITAFNNAGIQVLVNQVVDIPLGKSLLQIAGVPDPAAHHFRHEGPDFSKVQEQFKENSFRIMLSHQPTLSLQSEKIGVDLQLSGHTHGGQFFPWNWLIVFFERYSKGLYKMARMQMYVNQGTGYWGPRIRLGTYCELTEIVLRKA